jgi:tetratricopeptide (TPR) repeat protein
MAIVLLFLLGIKHPGMVWCMDLPNTAASETPTASAESLVAPLNQITQASTPWGLKMAQFNALQAKGMYSAAEKVLREALSLCDIKLNGPKPSDTYARQTLITLYKMACLYSNMYQLDQAEALFGMLLQATDIMGLKTSDSYVNLLDDLAEVYRLEEHYDDAQTTMKEALSIENKLNQPNGLYMARSLMILGLIEVSQNKLDEAKSHLEKSEELLKQPAIQKNDNFSIQAPILNALGEINRLQGNYMSAEHYFQQFIDLYTQHGMANHPGLILPLCNLGAVYTTQGDYTKAEALLNQALQIATNVYGPDFIGLARVKALLGDLFFNQKKYTAAESELKKAISLYEGKYSKTYSSIASVCIDLAAVYMAQGNLEQAESVLNRAKDIAAQKPELTQSLMPHIQKLEQVLKKLKSTPTVT